MQHQETDTPELTNLIPISGGYGIMGSEDFYEEEKPLRRVEVHDFEIEQHPVTNQQFSRFILETGYVTEAEQPLPAEVFPGLEAEALHPGGLVFKPTSGPVPLDQWNLWWHWVPGASWKHPYGPGSNLNGRERHPVVMVSYNDANAYAQWAGRRLPTEIEWEYAARAGAQTSVYAWGDSVQPDGKIMANTWQGSFPYLNKGAEGWVGTSPVGSFPPNAYGLSDMIGNVWEWTQTHFHRGEHRVEADQRVEQSVAAAEEVSSCCSPQRTESLRDNLETSSKTDATQEHGALINHDNQRVVKGGSHLCAPEYCHRYRPAARSPQTEDSSTTHIGFRCVAL